MSAGLAPGKTIGDGIDEMDRIAKKVLDESFTTALSGPSRDYAESSSNIVFAFVLALVLIYLVLAAQFESFRDPFTIMLTVPLALAGALLSLWVFGKTLNIFSEIGIIMLIGLVTKNGILIVEFANQQKEKGTETPRSGAGCRGSALPPDSDDESCHDARRIADRPCTRRQRKEPRLDGDCCDRRTLLLARADAVRHSGDVHVLLEREENG